ncbi:hypothetical protein YR33_004576 [Salmonella enterica subsp. enterica]|nr:hypothetical protein [Salmonella enterica subsp. enterica]
MIVFQQGYTVNDISRINEYSGRQKARIVYVKNKDEFVDFLRKRKSKKRLIKKMVFFCHGIIDFATFPYQGDDVEAGLFGTDEIDKIYESIFDYDAEIITYACRAGISVDDIDLTGKNAGQKQNPAQIMADTWDVKVSAFEMRSLYKDIYGTPEEIKKVARDNKTIEKYHTDLARYNYEKLLGNDNIQKPTKPDGYDEMIRQKNEIDEREENARNGGGPIAPNGSWCFPTTGESPRGLKQGLQSYKPLEWRIK